MIRFSKYRRSSRLAIINVDSFWPGPGGATRRRVRGRTDSRISEVGCVSSLRDGVGPGSQPVRTPARRHRVGGRPVVIELQVRRFRCCERICPQATFAEQVDGLTFQHGW